MFARLVCTLLVVPVAACAADGSDTDTGSDVPEGYVRFEPPPITLEPGQSGQWVQYVADPVDYDRDVIDLIGLQGTGGHHAILYATAELEPIGTTRDWTNVDQIADRFLGGLGGEGAESITLPEGAVFRVPAGHALYVQTHYFNATPAPIDGWSRLDVKFAEASDQTPVSLFSNVDLTFELGAGVTTRTTECTVGEDVDLLMITNHVHEWGLSSKTTMTVDGVETVLKDDPSWNYEWATNPNFQKLSLAEPLRIPAGALLSTTCTWDNDTGRTLTFPDEMCLFFGFSTSARDLACVDGDWNGD